MAGQAISMCCLLVTPSHRDNHRYLRASRDMSYIFSGRRQSGRDTTFTPATSMVHHRSASSLALVPTKSSIAMESKLKGSETGLMIARPMGHSVAGKNRDNIPLVIVPQRRQQASSVSQAYGMLCVHMNFTYCVGSSGKALEVLGDSHTRVQYFLIVMRTVMRLVGYKDTKDNHN
jgi:hypothetical protein